MVPITSQLLTRLAKLAQAKSGGAVATSRIFIEMPSISAFGCFFDGSVGVGVNLQAGEYSRHVQAKDSLSGYRLPI
jgi:hypothetical protein